MTRVAQFRTGPALLSIILAVVPGCATQPAATPEEVAEVALAQSEWFRSLVPKQPLSRVLSPVVAYQQSSFEVLSNAVVHQYIQGQFPLTNVMFGVYFKDGLLESLILDQQVGDFAWCRTRSWTDEHWLANQGHSFSTWLQQHNQLAGSFDPGMHHPPVVTERMGAAEVAEAMTYLPIIAIALPHYGADQLAGGAQRDARQKKLNQQLVAAAMGLHVGHSTRDEVLQSLGSADEKTTAGKTEIWRYRKPGIWIGIVDGVVTWKESGSPYPPTNSVVKFTHDCSHILSR